jgi:hypothetical protein
MTLATTLTRALIGQPSSRTPSIANVLSIVACFYKSLDEPHHISLQSLLALFIGF